MGVSWVQLAIVQIEARDGWQHISVPLLAFANNNLNQLVLNFAGNPPSATVGTIVYLVDNLELTVPAGPAPSLSLEKPPPTGLNLFTTDNVYGRQNIRTVETNLTWVGASAPVTYSVTVAAFPVSSVYSNFQTHMLLVADPPAAAGQSDPDWNATNVVRFDIGNNADRSGYASFRFKTNAPGSNGTYYDVGTLGNVGSATVVGTWSVTFDQDTNVTLTSPDGTTTQLVFPAEAVPFFNTPNFRVYFGAMPNNAPNVGQAAVLGGAAVSGAGGSVSDDFSGAQLDPQKWEVSAILPANVVQVPADAAFWLSWTLPDNQYVLRATSNLADPNSWVDLPLPTSTYAGKRRVIIPAGQPGASQGYFELVKPATP
jgi:hypothetical protein